MAARSALWPAPLRAAPPRRPDPHRSPYADNAVRPSVVQSAEALCKTAGAMLATLDHIALLVVHIGRGEPVPFDELVNMGPAIEASRIAMVGIMAGLTSAELCRAL